MKMKNSRVVTKYREISEVMNKKEKLPVAFSFAIMKNFKTLESLNEDFMKQQNKLLDEYNVKNDKGDPAYKDTGKIEIASECMEQWKKDITDLLDIEVEFEPHMVNVEVLKDTNIAAEDLYICDFMINE